MARPRALVLAGLCLCALTAHVSAAGAGGGGGTGFDRPTTYTDLDSVKGQFAISFETTTGAGNAFEPKVCDANAIAAPCNQPPLTAEDGDKVRVTAKLAAPLKTLNNAAPTTVWIRLCFSKPFTADRPWRKPADVVDKDKSCPQTLAKLPIAANSTYTATWTVPKAAPKATWYAQVLVECTGAEGPVFCQTDSTAGKAFVATQIINSTPVSMKVAVAICSAIAPAFLAAFFIKERVMKKSA